MSIEKVQELPQPIPLEKLAKYFEQFQQVKSSIIIKGVDTVNINGKEHVKRSGWRKLATAFSISDSIEKEEYDPQTKVWTVWAKAFWGSRSCVGVGACSVGEREKAKSTHPEHDAYAIAHTRAKNRAISDILGSGEVSAEEIEAEHTELKRFETKK